MFSFSIKLVCMSFTKVTLWCVKHFLEHQANMRYCDLENKREQEQEVSEAVV